MIPYLTLSVAAVIPAVFLRCGKRWFGEQTHPVAISILSLMGCLGLLSFTDAVSPVSGGAALMWVALTTGGIIFRGRIEKMLPRCEAPRAMTALEAGGGRSELSLDERREVEMIWAFLIAMGILTALAGLPAVLELAVTREFDRMQLMFPFGVAGTVCGFALKNGRRHAWGAAVVFCVAGMALMVPLGLSLYGLQLWSLIRVRGVYAAGRAGGGLGKPAEA